MFFYFLLFNLFNLATIDHKGQTIYYNMLYNDDRLRRYYSEWKIERERERIRIMYGLPKDQKITKEMRSASVSSILSPKIEQSQVIFNRNSMRSSAPERLVLDEQPPDLPPAIKSPILPTISIDKIDSKSSNIKKVAILEPKNEPPKPVRPTKSPRPLSVNVAQLKEQYQTVRNSQLY